MPRVCRLVVLSILLVGPAKPIPAFAQQATGTVQGVVLDQSAAIVPGVELTLLNVATGVATVQRSNDQGFYTFTAVQPGTYTLTAARQSFKTSEVRDIAVAVARQTVVDVVIQAGGVEETVTVSASAELIDTRSAVVGTNVQSRTVLAIPLASRNSLVAAELAPGVSVSTGALTGGSQMLGQDGVRANASGSRQQLNTFYLDGADNSGPLKNFGLQVPNPETVQEVQVTTSSNSAEFGRQPGGYFNVVTKSGTNALDGSLFYFGTDEALNANEWGRNRLGLGKAPANRKQFGATLGGPVLRNRTFFFAAYQRFQDEGVELVQNVRVPTARMLAGDFSEFRGPLFNPATGQPIANNDIATAGLLDPVAVNLAQSGLIPTVQALGDTIAWEFQREPKSNEILGKVDHNFSQAHRTSVSVFRVWGESQDRLGSVPSAAAGLTTAKQATLSVRHTWVPSPALVVEGRFSSARHENEQGVDDSLVGRDIRDFGARWFSAIADGERYLPNIEILDGMTLGSVGRAGTLEQRNYKAGGTLTWLKGRQTIKAGYEYQQASVSRLDDISIAQFRFQGNFSSLRNRTPPGVPFATFGYSVADMMMGRIENFSSGDSLIGFEVDGGSHGLFLQDEWKLNTRMTLTPGVRYEVYSAPSERSGKAAAFIDGHRSNQFPNAPLHFAFEGDSGVPAGFIETDTNNIAPRLQFAWDLEGNGRTALRAGYGTFYAHPALQTQVWAATEFPMVATAQAQQALLRDPWGTSVLPVYPTPPVPFPSDYLDYLSSYNFVAPFARNIGFESDLKTPYFHQWNVSVEREIWSNITVTAGYIGNRGRNLLQAYPYNFSRFVTVNGQPPSSAAANVQARVPYQMLSRFSLLVRDVGRSWYDALQVSATVRAAGLYVRPLYVYAHSKGDVGGGAFTGSDEDPEGFTTQANNPGGDQELEIGNRERRHTFRTFYVYDLPFFRDQSRLTGKILGGWQLAGNVYLLSGPPMDIVLGADVNFDAISSQPQDRPDVTGPITYTDGSRDERMARYLDPSVFRRPVITADNLGGNLRRNALWGPGSWFSDMALSKDFRVGRDMRVQVRVEAYNVFNHPNLDPPRQTGGANLGFNMASADFNRLLTLSGNRTMQYALKWYF